MGNAAYKKEKTLSPSFPYRRLSMPIFLFITDLHSQRHVFAPLEATLDRLRPDAVFCLGDLTDGARTAVEYTEDFLKIFTDRDLPIRCISGNNDAKKSLKLLEERDVLLDYREREVLGTRVVGLGYHPSEEPFTPQLRESILLTHLPPKRNSVPDTVSNVPRFHLSGHYHSRERIWRLNSTFVVQVPSAMNYRATTLLMPRGWVEFIDLK